MNNGQNSFSGEFVNRIFYSFTRLELYVHRVNPRKPEEQKNARAIAFTSIDYTDELALEESYGAGIAPKDVGIGNYKANASLEVLREDYERVFALFFQAGILHPPFTFTVIYSAPQSIRSPNGKSVDVSSPVIKDTLRECRLIKRPLSSSTSSKLVTMKLDFLVQNGIVWNGVEPFQTAGGA